MKSRVHMSSCGYSFCISFFHLKRESGSRRLYNFIQHTFGRRTTVTALCNSLLQIHILREILDAVSVMASPPSPLPPDPMGASVRCKDPSRDPELSSKIERLLQAEMMTMRAGIDPAVGGWSGGWHAGHTNQMISSRASEFQVSKTAWMIHARHPL